MNTTISVIIPVYNGEKTLDKCLNAVFKSTYKNLEVILVDDASTDRTIEIAKKYTCKILRLEKRRGPAVARNFGASHAKGEILFFTDADVEILSNTIELGAGTLLSNCEYVALIGSYTAETPERNFVTRYKNYLHHYTHQKSNGEVSSFFTACGFIYKNVFNELNGFDESITTTALEDVDLGYRLNIKNYKTLLEVSIQVQHLKKYNLINLVKSDVFERAVPYTKLMLKYRIFRGELSTGYSNILSVIAIYLYLLKEFFRVVENRETEHK